MYDVKFERANTRMWIISDGTMKLVLWNFLLAVMLDRATGTGEWSEDAEDLGKFVVLVFT